MSVKEECNKVPVIGQVLLCRKALLNTSILPCNDGEDCMVSQSTRLEKCEYILFFFQLAFFTVRYCKSLRMNVILSCSKYMENSITSKLSKVSSVTFLPFALAIVLIIFTALVTFPCETSQRTDSKTKLQ